MIGEFYKNYIFSFMNDYMKGQVSLEKIAKEADCDVKMVIRVLHYNILNDKLNRKISTFQRDYNNGKISVFEISDMLDVDKLRVKKVLEPKLVLFNQRNFEKNEKMNAKSKPIIKPKDLTIGDWRDMNWKQKRAYEK